MYGWSFNASGTEAYNTCYDYDEGEGLAYGLTYKVHFPTLGLRPLTARYSPTGRRSHLGMRKSAIAYLGDTLTVPSSTAMARHWLCSTSCAASLLRTL